MLGSQETESAVWKLGGFSGHTAWAAAPGWGWGVLGTRRQGLCLGRGRLMPGGNPAVTLPSRPQQPHPQDVACYRRTSMQGCEFVWQLLLSS